MKTQKISQRVTERMAPSNRGRPTRCPTTNKIAFATLGCKANWVDTESVRLFLEEKGAAIVPFTESADIYVIFTCTVTSIADAQSRQMIRRPKRINPNATVLVCGCLAKTDPKEVEKIDDVDAVFAPDQIRDLINFICDLSFRRRPESSDFKHSWIPTFVGMTSFPISPQSRARAFLKIQDGCNKFCSYCIVPYARGRVKSMPVPDVVAACRSLSRYHNEIILTGIDISQYEIDFKDGSNLLNLLKMLDGDDEISRIRISSIDPSVVNDEFIDFFASAKKMCRHIHLSIQSLSDNVLGNMGRRYKSEDVVRSTNELCNRIKGIAVTGDIIAGFATESEDDHLNTVANLELIPIAGLHVFPYSARKGTNAFSFEDCVPCSVKKERALQLREIANNKRTHFLKGLEGQKLKVIVISKSAKDGLVEAFSDNAVKVFLPDGHLSYGKMGTALVRDLSNQKVRGIWV